MKLKTSVTLSEQVVAALDRIGGRRANRSRLVELAVVEFIQRRERALRDSHDLAILNRAADRLNRQMAEVLRDQDEP